MRLTAAEFVMHEAHLLDTRRFDDWLGLFADDGRYWVPLLGAEQQDTTGHNSIALEDRLLLSLRIERLKDPRAHSQHPPSHCQHILQAPQQCGPAVDGVLQVRTPFLYLESRGAHEIMLSGSCLHTLIESETETGWRIREKRVDLLNPTRALPAIQLFI
jgi:3-phenylpropionate/cinnamic acid dioxygenase small subunit